MKIGKRLIVTLVPAVATVMGVFAAWALRQREAVIVAEAREETEAYATAFSLAVEYAFADQEAGAVQGMLNQVSRQPKIYGVLVYGEQGRLLFISDPLRAPRPAPRDSLRRVLTEGATISIDRDIDRRHVYSVLRPIRADDGRIIGAVEVAQPLDFVDAEKARVRDRFLLNTLVLLLATVVATLWLVRRFVSRPIGGFVTAARAVGRGELGHRLPETRSRGELAELTTEFNRMASGLEAAHTRLVRQAEDRLALERRLRHSEKLAAVGSLAVGLAHEIAAPLNVISGRTEMVLKRSELPEREERNLRIIVGQIGRITTIVRNLLESARPREPHLRPMDLASVLDAVTELLEDSMAQSGVRVERADPRPLWVTGDPDQLQQVFVNLFLNALQAMEGTERDRRIEVRLAEASNESVVLEVADTGPGIPPDVLKRIFEPFVTTKAGGTGLGLLMARNIVEEHRGSLEASNRPEGRGALFRIGLPTAQEPPPSNE